MHHGARPGREQYHATMKKITDKLTEQRALDTFTEKPESFELETKDGTIETLYLYPLQLGRLAMISRHLMDLDIVLGDENIEDAVKKMWTVCSENTRQVAEIIAIATLRTKQEIDEHLEERIELICWSPTMQPAALTNILSTIVFQSFYADFMTAIRSVKTLQVTISPRIAVGRVATTEDVVSGDK